MNKNRNKFKTNGHDMLSCEMFKITHRCQYYEKNTHKK